MGIWLWQEDKTFLVTSGLLLFRKVWWAVLISTFWPKFEVFYRLKWTNGTPHENWAWILSIFRFRNEYYKQIGKSRWKIWGHFPNWVIVCKLPKKLYFLQFCADLNKKSKSTKAIYIYASERSRYALLEIGVVYYTITYCFRSMSVWIWSILRNFCWVSIFSDILIANI